MKKLGCSVAAALLVAGVMSLLSGHALAAGDDGQRSIQTVLDRLAALERKSTSLETENAMLRERVRRLESSKQQAASAARSVEPGFVAAATPAAATSARSAYAAAPGSAQPALSRAWTGPRVGGTLGIRKGESDWTTTQVVSPPAFPFNSDVSQITPYDSTGIRVGGFLGYDWQLTRRLVVGVEGDIAWGDQTKTVNAIPGAASASIFSFNDTSNVQLMGDASVRGRFGYLVTPDALVYATGGVAFQQMTVSIACGMIRAGICSVGGAPSQSAILIGWTAGIGTEIDIQDGWFGRFEYRYSQFPTFTNTFGFSNGASVKADIDVDTHIFTTGVGYRF
jgi:outer membrane immunogenic protein